MSILRRFVGRVITAPTRSERESLAFVLEFDDCVAGMFASL